MNEDRFGSPAWLMDALQAHFGAFNTDLAAEPWSAVVPCFITKEMDLFRQRVAIGHAFMNPPYGRGQLGRFVGHGRRLVVEASVRELTMLVPHYTAEGWWELVERPEGRVLKCEWRYKHIAHPRLANWKRLVGEGLVIDIVPIAGRLKHRFPPGYRGAKEMARFSSVVVRFVHPEAA